jgi:outer membrane receptor protein involved in Fe transport
MVSLPLRTMVLLALPLAAQDAPKAAPQLDLAAEMADILATDQIGAASKHVQDLASAPADVVVLRSSELKALGYRTLGDALGGVLGFRTNEDHAYQGLAAGGLYTLGDQNTRILVLLDGHALNSPAEVGSSKVGEDFGLPLELVDHVEIVRGPASSLYGNNAFQALVNVVSVSAAGERQKPFQAAVTAGSDGLSELWAQQTVDLDGVTASLMLSGFQRTGTALTFPQQSPEAMPERADREERQNAYLYLRGHQWSFQGAVLSRTQGLASGPYQSVPGNPGNWYRNRRMYGEFKWEPATEATHWMVRLFGDRNEFDDHFVLPSAPVVDSGDSDPDRSLGGEVQGRFTLGEGFGLTVGTEQQFHRFNGRFAAQGTEIDTDVAYRVGNSYLEANWQPAAAWNVVAGLQWAQWQPTQVHNVDNGTTQDLAKESIDRLTPRLSAIWKPASADVVKFIYGQGFRFPTIFEEYYTDGTAATGGTQSPNPDLKPEVLSSYQASWTRKWSSQLSTHGAVTLLRGEHTIQASTDASGLEQYQNAADPLKGTTVEGEATWHRDGTELYGGAGWYRWTYQGADWPDSTRWLGVFRAIQRLGDWSLAGEARYVAGRDNPDLGVAGQATRVPGTWTLRASVRREWNWGWAQVSGEDLGNSRRRDLVGEEYQPVTWMEGDGRAVRGTLGIRF